ncbi:hypothetical protein AQUCO_02500134v1 [Aquilegia coerulea]|uniref:Protein kinase domain-containing protein n=1 Tax=Aquilegia coerulea TaxID=218851 RepID=A0A2G5D9M9_AQUCA|nr:hypothetical protein AQUCO_02500134v1 [Aquilegia coerulea]
MNQRSRLLHPPPPPPPPLHQISLSIIIILIIINPTVANPCDSKTSVSCPPFISPLSFPFSAILGCGHPDFQLRCTTPHSIISINNISFSILSYEPNTTSIHISPLLTESTHRSSSLCSFSSSFTSLPTHSINLTNTPFHFSDHSCSRLSVVKPCTSNLTSLCGWETELLNNPIHLLHGCRSNQRLQSEQGCKPDVLDYLQSFLKWGFEIEWNEEDEGNPYFSNCKSCRDKNGVCGYNSSDSQKQFLCFHSQSHITQSWIQRDNPNRIVLLCTLFICGCILAVVGVITVIFRHRRANSATNEEDPTMLFLHRQRSASLLPPVFNYEELDSATNRFDPRRKIGDGGFGSVYLGQLYDNRIVAVKKLHKPPQSMTRTNSEKAFCNEILILSSIQHPNLVKLHGYCSDSKGLLLVYDYVPNGTLADHLHDSKSLYRKGGVLTWQIRVEIALQTAMAIEYLHFGVKPAIVHRDITSSNIFIEKDMRIKLGDFGLSRLLICSESSSSSSSSGSGFICTGPQGTPGYLDPDYHRSFRLTEKSDVYSFGVVLFELISGMKAVDLARDKREMALADLVVSKIQVGSLHQVVDPVLVSEGEAMGTVDSMAELGFRCVAADKDDRPDAKEIVAELKRIKNGIRGGGHRAALNISGDLCKI